MEQSATPWRVFDAQANSNDPGSGGAAAASPPGVAHADRSVAGLAGPGMRMAIAGVVGAVLIGAVAIAIALSSTGGQIVDAPDKALPGTNETALLVGAGTGGGTIGGQIVVDVTGAVAKPGVYRLPAGSRVGDAIDAAGGFSPRVDADAVASVLNLAAALTDGAQVSVPSRDDASPSGGGSGSTPGSGGAPQGRLVNLNSATESELDALPGIGPVTAKKIIESRTAQPFTAIDDLRARKLVGEKAFDQLKSLVTVG